MTSTAWTRVACWSTVGVAVAAAGAEVAATPTGTWAERLGFPAGRRVLILHADDVGMCHEANAAAGTYLPAGVVQSAAVMAPCPWFAEAAAWVREHPEYDVGLHVTLTSEWKHYRWPPVLPAARVPGLVDPEGRLWRSVADVVAHATAVEVEAEIRAQVEAALARGFRPSHLDTHMGTVYAKPEFTAAYLKVAVEYGIPAMVIELTPTAAEHFRSQGYPIDEAMVAQARRYPLPKLDAFLSMPDGTTYEEKVQRFQALVRSLPPGLTEIVFHPSTESDTLRAITNSWQQRVWEARLFQDPAVQRFLAEEAVLTNWRELMRRCGAVPPAK